MRLPSVNERLRLGELHAVMGHDPVGAPADVDREHPGGGHIDQTQADAVAAPDRAPREQGPGEVAHPPATGEVVTDAEILVQRADVLEPPVVEDDGNVAVDSGPVPFLDDQWAVKAPGDLFSGAVVGVVPIVPAWGASNALSKVIPGSTAAWVRSGTPSIALSRLMPCQWMAERRPNPFSKVIAARSPC